MKPALFLAGAVLLAASRLAAAPAPSCPAVDGAELGHATLPHLAAALKPGGTLNVLAVGSATLFGPQTNETADIAPAHGAPVPTPSATGFPWQMAQALQAGVKNLHVNVSFIGGHGQPADAMLGKLQAEISRRRYQLVIWQTGTVEAVSEAAPDDFYQTLSDGAAAIANAGADLVLVNPQYSRFLEANANLAPYLSALQAAGALPGVALFDRYGIMRDWVDGGALDLEHTARQDRPAVAARLHLCLGRALAQMLDGD